MKELVGSHPSQDRLYHWFKSNDYGRILSDNNAYIKDKRMVCLSYRSEFEVIRNFCVPLPGTARTSRLRLREAGAHA